MLNYGILFCFGVWFAMQATHYEILKIPPTATQKEIRAAYLRQAKKVHPDKSIDADAVRIFQSLGDAYSTLKDPESRRQYDAILNNEDHEYDILSECANYTCATISLFKLYTFFFFAPCLNNHSVPE